MGSAVRWLCAMLSAETRRRRHRTHRVAPALRVICSTSTACRCTHYEERHVRVPDCIEFDAAAVPGLHWLPQTCAYRLRSEGRDLMWWHYLVSGDRETVHRAGISVRGRATSEAYVHPDDMESRIVHWIEPKTAERALMETTIAWIVVGVAGLGDARGSFLLTRWITNAWLRSLLRLLCGGVADAAVEYSGRRRAIRARVHRRVVRRCVPSRWQSASGADGARTGEPRRDHRVSSWSA